MAHGGDWWIKLREKKVIGHETKSKIKEDGDGESVVTYEIPNRLGFIYCSITTKYRLY